MDTLIGVLLDVSGSMKASIGTERPNEKRRSWARSIFKVVDSLIKHDVSSSNNVFALGFGASREPQTFDLLGTVKENTKLLPLPYKNQTKDEIIDHLVENLPEMNFLKFFRLQQFHVAIRLACKDALMKVLTKEDACLFAEESNHNHNFKIKFQSIQHQFQNLKIRSIVSGIGSVELARNCLPSQYESENSPVEVNSLSKSLTGMILEEILTILERNGAPRVRTWANMNVLLDVVKLSEARSFLDDLRRDDTLRRRFVMECLPETCRTLTHSAASYGKETFNFVTYYVAPSVREYATRDSVEDVVAKGKELMKELRILELVPIGQEAIIDVHKASEILHGGIGEGELTDERVDELMDIVEPLIYGGTPMMTTIDKAKNLFSSWKFKDHKKLMFIISDGESQDGHSPPIEELAQLGVTTVCCYITDKPIADPKHLYSTRCRTWDEAAKLMFRMSSTITTQDIPRTIFVKRGWTIDITNNETRLFAQVNHPDIIEDVCDLARDVVCCQDALSDLLATVSLDLYINQANQGFHPKKQVGGTCYANASAAVLHLSMQRIVGRKGGYPDFFELREEMIQKYGQHGANTLTVLKEMCPKYRLHCKEVDIQGALEAITAKRPVLARFWLTDSEWDIFDDFYEQSPQGILSSAILRRQERAGTIGHAVVLTSFNSECLRLMNSAGDTWGDCGFFKVANADVLGLEFVDVFWTKEDLKPSEIKAYNRYGPSNARKMFTKLQGLQNMDYPCPSCHQRSNVNEFSGNHLEARCPKCDQEFRIKEAGDDLALNMYLLSLTRGDKKNN